MVTICTTTFKYTAILRSAHKVYLYVLCGSQNKQRSFRYKCKHFVLMLRVLVLAVTTHIILIRQYSTAVKTLHYPLLRHLATGRLCQVSPKPVNMGDFASATWRDSVSHDALSCVATEPLSVFAYIALLTLAIIACLWYVNTAGNVAIQVFLVLWIGQIDKDHGTL